MPKSYAEIGSDFLLWFQNDAPFMRTMEEIDQQTFDTILESMFSLTDRMELFDFCRLKVSSEQIEEFAKKTGKQVLEWRNSTAYEIANDEYFPTLNERFETIISPFFFDQSTVDIVLTNLDIKVFGIRSPAPDSTASDIEQEITISKPSKHESILDGLLKSFTDILKDHTEKITSLNKPDAYDALEKIAGEIVELLNETYGEKSSMNSMILKYVKPVLKPLYGRTKSISANTLKILFKLRKNGIF